VSGDVYERGRRLDVDDPVILDLLQRVSRLEAQTSSLNESVSRLREGVERLEGRLWAILTGVVLSILLQVLMRLLH